MKNLAFLIVILLLFGCQAEHTAIYVSPEGHRLNPGTRKSPVATIEQAQQVLREKMKQYPNEDIYLRFFAGEYILKKTLAIADAQDSAYTGSIIYQGSKDKEVVFSGGQEVSGWVEENGIWQVNLKDVGKVEQLYVDGQRAIRARIPNASDEPSRWYLDSVHAIKDRTNESFVQFDIWVKEQSLLPDFNSGGKAEIIVFKDWATLRHSIAAYNQRDGRFVLQPPFAMFDGNYNGLLAPYVNRFTCYLEGHKAFIDQPGEWAFDAKAGTLYYKPLPDQDIEDTRVIVPVLETLMTLKGDIDKRIKEVHFENIHFKHAAYQLPEFGHDGRQACFYYSKGTDVPTDEALLTEAIRLEWVEHCSFTNCSLSQTGGNGIYITTGSQSILLDNVELADIGGNGLMIGMAKDPGLDSEELVKGISFKNGNVTKAGRHYDSAVGIWLGFCRDCSIVGNDVYDLPYTGISVGWQWNPIPSSSGGNLIEGNHIYQVMQMLGDGGGIYTLGFQPGSVIRGNLIHDILRSELNHASPNNGMFIDEGSKGFLIEGNHIYEVSHTCIRGHRAAGVELRNNKFEPGEFPAISHTPPYGNMIFANQDSTIAWPNPGWPEEWGYSEFVTAFRMNNNKFDK